MDFRKAKSRAQRIVRNREKLMELINATLSKLKNTEDRHELISKAKVKLSTLVRMMRAYIRGDYKEVPWKTIIMVTAGLIYFVNPFDVVPDIVPVAGMLDDAALIIWIFNMIGKDVDAFVEWESTSATVNPD